MILSKINQLLVSKQLIVNTITNATQQQTVPRTVTEVENGLIPSTNPYFKKNINKILQDLQAFIVNNGDSKRIASSESTASSEILVSDDSSSLQSNSYMLQAAWGYLNTDSTGTALTPALEQAFNSYIGVIRSIGSWTLYVFKMKDLITVKVGASALSELTANWGPVPLDKDLDNFYNKLFGPLYYHTLDGKVKAVLDCTPIGLSVTQVQKQGLTFDDSGFLTIPLPSPTANSSILNPRQYITYVDYTVAEDSCGTPEVTIKQSWDKCDKQIVTQLIAYEDVPICKKVIPIPSPVPPLPPIDPPVPIKPPVPIPPPNIIPQATKPYAIMFIIDCTAGEGTTLNWEDQMGSNAGIPQTEAGPIEPSPNDPLYFGAVAGIQFFADEILGQNSKNYIGVVSFSNNPQVIVSLGDTNPFFTFPSNYNSLIQNSGTTLTGPDGKAVEVGGNLIVAQQLNKYTNFEVNSICTHQ